MQGVITITQEFFGHISGTAKTKEKRQHKGSLVAIMFRVQRQYSNGFGCKSHMFCLFLANSPEWGIKYGNLTHRHTYTHGRTHTHTNKQLC